MLSLLVAVVVMALIFDYINGFHDAANAIATSVATGVMPMRTAVIGAAIFNFVGAMVGTAVAKTIASGFCETAVATQTVVLAALIGASAWNLLTWWWGLPSSSSHALIGGLCGAVVASAGFGAFHWSTLGTKVLVPLVLSPLIGFFLAFLVMLALLWLVHGRRPVMVNTVARRLQILTACAMSYAHGSNDAQKSMGIITLAVVGFAATCPGVLPGRLLPHAAGEVPVWVIVACATAIALGTMAGGKRIIKTMGTRISHITPVEGISAESSGTAIILANSYLGLPISTTHCINACIMGVGACRRLAAVRWGTVLEILVAWVLTMPAAALIAACAEVILRLCLGPGC